MVRKEGNQASVVVGIENGETPAAKNPPTPPNVLEQARFGTLDQFRKEFQTALESGDDPLALRFGHHRTLLHFAAMDGQEKVVEFMLSVRGISREVVNAKDDFGYTPLHLAVRSSHENVVRLLTTSSLVLPDRFLAATSEPDDLGEHYGGSTPLHLAAMGGHIAIAKLLLRQPRQVEFAYDPMNIFAVTWCNLTAMDLARERKFQDLEEFLEASDLNWLLQERARCGITVNVTLVGAALVAAATFTTWLQPPGGIPAASDSSASSGAPTPSPSASPSSPRSDRKMNAFFYMSVAIAFSFSILSLALGIVATFPFPRASVQLDLRMLRWALNLARQALLVALASLIMAFLFAGLVVYDMVASTENTLYKVFFRALCIYFLLLLMGFFSFLISTGHKRTTWNISSLILISFAPAYMYLCTMGPPLLNRSRTILTYWFTEFIG